MDGVVHAAHLWSAYIWPAYALTIGGLVALLAWSWIAMRRAEKRAEDMRRR
jgi:heme exporter protein CcmD